MKDFIKKHQRILIDIAVLFAVFLFVFISYFIFKPLYFRNGNIGTTDGIIPRLYIFMCLTALVITGAVLKIKNKLTIEVLLFLIFLVGVVMQLNYMLITPVNYRQHDVGGDDGHEAYAHAYILQQLERPHRHNANQNELGKGRINLLCQRNGGEEHPPKEA